MTHVVVVVEVLDEVGVAGTVGRGGRDEEAEAEDTWWRKSVSTEK